MQPSSFRNRYIRKGKNMKKKLIVIGILMLSLSACSSQQTERPKHNTKKQQTAQETKNSDQQQKKQPADNAAEESAASQPGTAANPSSSAGSADTVPLENADPAANAGETQELSIEEMYRRFHLKFYGTENPGNEVMEVLTGERAKVNLHSKYDEDMNYYFEQILGVTDVSNAIEPIFFTDMKYYTAKDFENLPPTVIHIAKNEIYARHGYIFKDEDLNQFFLSCAWYQPRVTGEEFDASVFNQYEQANLKLLSELDRQLLPTE